MKKRTKIVATLGPSSENPAVIEKMIRAGMNAARLNLSHGSWDNHKKLIKNIRAAAEKLSEPVAVMADFQGPRIRVGDIGVRGLTLLPREKAVFDASLESVSGGKIPLICPDLGKDLKAGQRILIDDGRLEFIVKKI